MASITKADLKQAIDVFERDGATALEKLVRDLRQFCNVLKRAIDEEHDGTQPR